LTGAYFEGQALPATSVGELATLPSREQLLAQFMGDIQSPMAMLAGLLNATLREFASLIEARAGQVDAGPGGHVPAAPAELVAESPTNAEETQVQPAEAVAAIEEDEEASTDDQAEGAVKEDETASEQAEGTPAEEAGEAPA
jgi:hypothetical protein